MAVARTYEKYELKGEPFKENGKMYVYVIASKGDKKVRWYSDAEYRRMYSQEEIKNSDNFMDFNARHAFGFGRAGYITIYAGDERVLEKCVESHHESFRRNLTFNYYTPSHVSLCDLPDGITPIRLNWEDVMDYDDRMKSHDEVRAYVLSLISNGTPSSTSNFVGAIGDWIEKEVNIKENTTRTSHFGDKHIHIMFDTEGNTYLWETGAKSLEVGMDVKLKMRVKEHKEMNGEKVTVVWYCKVI